MSTPRFDPADGLSYGTCNTCTIDLPTKQDADVHMSTTLEEARTTGGRCGHSVHVRNPARSTRINHEIWNLLEDALQGLMSKVDDLIAADHITEEEAGEALSQQHVDLSDAWKEYSA